jgi:hypothetical protein
MNETSSVSCNTVPFVTQNLLFGGWRFRVDGSNSRLQYIDIKWLSFTAAVGPGCVSKLDGRGRSSSFFVLSPERAIEGVVLDGLGDVLGLDRFSSFQVGDCSWTFRIRS